MRRAALLLLAVLSACGTGADKGEIERIRQATAAVRAQLPQPETAQFRNVEVRREAVCGEVNASMGMGMVGYDRFVVAGGKVTIGSQLPTMAAMDALWAKDCAG